MPAGTSLSISIVDSKTKGIPTAFCRCADGREFYLHSRYDPLEEARFLVNEVPCLERTMYVVSGFGLGYHVKALLQRIPQSSHIVVMEPESACLSGELRKHPKDPSRTWMHGSRLHFFTHSDPKVAPIFLADRLVALRMLSLEMVTHLPSTLTAESFYRTLLDEIPQTFPASFQRHLNSLDQMLENDLRNFWANLPFSWNAAPVTGLSRMWAGRPLIIVSPGPSLTGALPQLREAVGKALIVATGPAARILIAAQVRPDLVVSVDPYEFNVAHFRGWDAADVPLVYYHRINRGVLTLHPGPKFYFVMQDEPPISPGGSPEKSGFCRGGSVAFSALQLAHLLEANPVIFVGQDFAFAGGHTHAAGCMTDRSLETGALPGDYLWVPGVDGTPVVTSRTYHSYLLYMQNYLLNFARVRPGVRHINTSRTGAQVGGMENLELGQALEAQAAPCGIIPRELIASLRRQHRPVSKQAQKAALEKWTSELDQLLMRIGPLEDFERLMDRFRTTSLYTQAGRSYDDILYLFETRYHAENPSRQAFLDRFKGHLQSVSTELHRMRSET